MKDHISAREHMAHALEQMMNIQEEEKSLNSGIPETEKNRKEREQRVKRSVNEFMGGDAQAKKEMNSVLNEFLNKDSSLENTQMS